MSQNFDLLNQLDIQTDSTKEASSSFLAAPRASVRALEGSSDQELLRMAQAIFLSEASDTPHVVVLCGVDQDNGSSQISNELGRILALCSHRPVCVLDDNARSQPQTTAFASSHAESHFEDRHEDFKQQGPNLWTATAEVFGDGDVLAPANQLKQAIAAWRRSFEFVIIAAPGVNVRGDAATLGQLADAVILVIEANTTRKAAALKAKTALEAAHIRLLGTVLNSRIYPIPEKLYRKL